MWCNQKKKKKAATTETIGEYLLYVSVSIYARNMWPHAMGPYCELANFRKTSTSALLTTPKPLTVWITITHGKFLKRWKYQTT